MANEGSEIGDLTAAQRAFLSRYLGVTLAEKGGTSQQTGAPLLPVWIAAKEQTDSQLDMLAAKLRESGLPLFQRIADAGLHGITQGQFTKLHVALSDLDRASGPAVEDAVQRARAAATMMREFLTDEPAVSLLETNPFGVKIALRAGLGAALDRIDANLGALEGGKP